MWGRMNSWLDCRYISQTGLNRPIMVEDQINKLVSIENIFLAHRAPLSFWKRLRETLRVAYYYWRMPSPANYAYSYKELGQAFRVVLKAAEEPEPEVVLPPSKGTEYIN